MCVCVCVCVLERDRNGHEMDLHPAFATEGHTRARRGRPSCEPLAHRLPFANNYNNNNCAGSPTGPCSSCQRLHECRFSRVPGVFANMAVRSVHIVSSFFPGVFFPSSTGRKRRALGGARVLSHSHLFARPPLITPSVRSDFYAVGLDE